MDRELLLEIGCEELPASWLPGLTNQVGEVIIAQLKEHRLPPEAPAETYSTPRRLTVRIARLAERQSDLEEVLNGPPVSAAFGADGAPTPAAVKDLVIEPMGAGEMKAPPRMRRRRGAVLHQPRTCRRGR